MYICGDVFVIAGKNQLFRLLHCEAEIQKAVDVCKESAHMKRHSLIYPGTDMETGKAGC